MRYVLFTVFVFSYLFSVAQKKANYLKIHAGAEVTTGLFADGYKTGVGIYATDYYSVVDGGSILISTGFASWKQKEGSGSAGAWLTRAGYRHFVTKPVYLQADAGVGIGTKNFSNATRFVFGGGIGCLLDNKSGSGFDISLRVNRGFNRTWIGIGAGYQFKL